MNKSNKARKPRPNNKKIPIQRGLRIPTNAGVFTSVAKADAESLNNLVRSGQLTPDGCDWLVSALDPFHDNARNLAGYPDVDSSRTTVTAYNFTWEVTSNLPNWQAHVYTLPVSAGTLYGSSAALGGHHAVLTQNTPAFALGYYPLGPINCVIAPPGTDMFPTSQAWNPANTTFLDTTAVADVLNSGYSRVIAAGFEVVNTSPNLLKGGDIITYRMPCNPTPSHYRVTDATANNLVTGSASYYVTRPPPATAAAAMLLRGSTEWEAAKGTYAPITMSSMINPLKSTTSQPIAIVASANDAASFAVVQKATGAVAAQPPEFWASKMNNQDIVGCHVLGQTLGAVLRLKYTVVVETAPSFTEVESCAYSSPSAVYDPEALKLYSQIVATMPIATVSANNANGDWFKAILKTIHSIARPISSIFGAKARKTVDDIYGVANRFLGHAGSVFPIIP